MTNSRANDPWNRDKPEGEPDVRLNAVWEFHWDKMVQWNSHERICYKIKIEDGIIRYYDDQRGLWRPYGLSEKDTAWNEEIMQHFNKHVESILLEENEETNCN